MYFHALSVVNACCIEKINHIFDAYNFQKKLSIQKAFVPATLVAILLLYYGITNKKPPKKSVDQKGILPSENSLSIIDNKITKDNGSNPKTNDLGMQRINEKKTRDKSIVTVEPASLQTSYLVPVLPQEIWEKIFLQVLNGEGAKSNYENLFYINKTL